MRSNQSCGSCRYWQVDEESQGLGLCRFNPPQVLLSQEEGRIPSALWPLTDQHDWCGKFEARRSTTRPRRQA